MVAIVGPSGSGKSTIMNMITGIDRATSGTVTVDGQRIDRMSEEELAVWRGRRVGVVFQFFQLLPTLTGLENAMLPLDFSRRVPERERAPLALRNLDLVGLADKADHLPSELSGGEQQRVAIARRDDSDQTAAGSVPLRVIGINRNAAGPTMVMLPLKTLQTALRSPGEINNYWISTTTQDHAAIDRITARVEDALAASGNQATTEERC